ncbi:hypothetical protein GLOTRDRAFT_34698 [Gloeophyllum trabeum ATCC 11539]|uniref:Uncharacterized protein n=1 Tax=Gloeophyllum trabeum (strain ATCC 11539 / FP-39264 / Madison 617) TaxID=670483 RepID=S7QK20_GLOTA|nr:uncharacterized protein GLOTRDRAFT_34698 [Gloeophyllum trabeum ATCC 11539]EPQ59573.1 hypothetical protein GLOTRDRAFT_34698 [Gloeophyllum trabeum ATCC 11539]
MSSARVANPVKDIAQKTLQANKDHQYALKVYTERLESELATVDKLLTSAEWEEQDDEADLDVGGFVLVPGSVKPSGPIAHGDFLSKESPFRDDATRRQRYLELTTIHPMKAKELDALAEAVRTENYRMHAYEAQRRGQNALTSLNQQPQSYFELNKEGIDWERVASKVSSSISSYVQRSAKECEIRWLGDRHPEINHGPWSDTEVAQVKALAANYPDGRVNWVKVAEQLGTNRTPIDCMRTAVPRRTHVWTAEADDRLLEAVKIYGLENWLLVARFVSEDATAQQCQNRYHRTLDPELARGPWTEEEDNRLRRAVEAYGHAWLEVATCVPGRSNEQCRDRWNERLNPKVIKGKWSEEEDRALIEVVGRLGEKWKEVSESLGTGRTDKQCRSRYEKLHKGKQREKEASTSTTTTPAVATNSSGTPDAPAPGPAVQSQASSSQTWQSLQIRMQDFGQNDGAGSSVDNQGAQATATTSSQATPRSRPRPRKAAAKPAGRDTPAEVPPKEDEAPGGDSSSPPAPMETNTTANSSSRKKRTRKSAAPAPDADAPTPKRSRSSKKKAVPPDTTDSEQAQDLPNQPGTS